MSRKRKYPKVVGYWVYTISIPSIGKFYIGVSKLQCSQRWNKSTYKDNSLEPYLDEWENMVKTVIQDNLTKEEAYQLEDALIQALNDLCINERRSGLIKVSDINTYQKELRKNNPKYHEKFNEYHKQYYQDNPEYRERKKQQAKQYYENNKESIKEKQRQRNQKKKIEKQNQQLNLFS